MQWVCAREFLSERLIRLHIEAGEKIKTAPPGRKRDVGCPFLLRLAAHPLLREPPRKTNGLGKHGVALCRGTPLTFPIRHRLACYNDPSVLRFMDQSARPRLMYGHGPTLHFAYPRSRLSSGVSTAPRSRAAKEALEQLKHVRCTGVRGCGLHP